MYKKYEPAFKGLKKREALNLEKKIKSGYEITDYEVDGGLGYKIINKANGKENIFSPNSRLTLETRYLEKDDGKKVTENVLDLITRVAVNIASADLKYDRNTDVESGSREFLEMMVNKDFMPNTPTLCNAGRKLQQLSACFVLPVEDYMAKDDILEDPEKQGNGICDCQRYMAMVHKSGGGTGFNFSYLRPRNDRIATTFGTSSGPISFMKFFDESTEAINQGGFRRGANMGIMEYWHPDIVEFINEKTNLFVNTETKEVRRSLGNFNLSIGVDDKFMGLVENGGYYKLINPKDKDKIPLKKRIWKAENLFQAKSFGNSEEEKRAEKEYKRQFNEANPSLLLSEDGKSVINRFNNKVIGKINGDREVLINARKLFDYVIETAWSIGDPGLLFLDKIDEENPTPHIGKIVSTNPCGEQPLLPYEACNLGSINVANCLKGKNLDYEKLEGIVRKSVHFLDNVIDMSKYPFKKIFHMAKGNRKIGLGIMGWGDLLYSLKIPYDSEEALGLAEKISGFVTEKARDESESLAKIKGEFPNWKGSVFDSEAGYNFEGKTGRKVRNATVTTLAPTGTIGMIADASGGVEPVYALYFEKVCMDNRELKYTVPLFEKELKERKLYSKTLLKKIKESGSIQNIEEIPDDIKRIFKTAHDIDPEWHVKMQVAFQRGIDNAVSKTVNLPNKATKQDVEDIYFLSWKLGCKGITAFRDGCRFEQEAKQVLRTRADLEEKIEVKDGYVVPRSRPEKIPGFTVRRKTGCGNLFVNVNMDEKGRPFEVFETMGKPGGCALAQTQAVGRLISYALRIGGNSKEIVGQLIDIKCDRPYTSLKGKVSRSKKNLSCPDAVGKALAEVIGMNLDGKIPNLPDDKFDSENFEAPGKTKNPEVKGELKGVGVCPKCGGSLEIRGGCRGGSCDCGFSTCD